MIEGEGGGIRAAQEAARDSLMQAPKFTDAGVRFTALMPRHSLLPPDDLAWLAALPEAAQLADVQRAIAVSMRHGTAWTNPLVRKEFAPIDSTEARAALQGLVVCGISVTRGEKRGTNYVIADRFRAPERTAAVEILRHVPEASVVLPPLASDLPETKVTNGVPILAALRANSELSAIQLATTTGLTRRQVMYALNKLRNHGVVERIGRSGAPHTVYALRHSDASQ